MAIDYRELLIKHMLCCIDCEGTPCILMEDDEDAAVDDPVYRPNAHLGISREEYEELEALSVLAKERFRRG